MLQDKESPLKNKPAARDRKSRGESPAENGPSDAGDGPVDESDEGPPTAPGDTGEG
jgi:hypothetical protein